MKKVFILIALILGLFCFTIKPSLSAPYIIPNAPILNTGGGSNGASNCVWTKVGDPKGDPDLSRCQGGLDFPAINGLTFPPNIQAHSTKKGYYALPKSPTGAYKSYTCSGRSWGSMELIGVINTTAERWKTKYPNGWINVGDLNATGHKSHKWGRAVDIDATTNGKDWVADFTKGNYNREATIELGKLLVDTNMVRSIWYNDPRVDSAVLEYAKSTGKSAAMVMHPIVGHDNHFHLDIEIPLLAVWEPGC